MLFQIIVQNLQPKTCKNHKALVWSTRFNTEILQQHYFEEFLEKKLENHGYIKM